MQPPWKYSVFLWFWLCFRTRISETLHFLRISCLGGHPQVRGGAGFSKLPMGPSFFLHTPCFHKLLLRFSHYPKQASEPGREPWPRPFWPMTFLPLACATHLASPLTRLHSSPLTPDPSPSPGLLTPWPLSLESLPLAPRPLTLTNELWHLALSPGPWTFTLCPGAIDVEMQDHTVNPLKKMGKTQIDPWHFHWNHMNTLQTHVAQMIFKHLSPNSAKPCPYNHQFWTSWHPNVATLTPHMLWK